jgi:hypothetical protein
VRLSSPFRDAARNKLDNRFSDRAAPATTKLTVATISRARFKSSDVGLSGTIGRLCAGQVGAQEQKKSAALNQNDPPPKFGAAAVSIIR